MGEGDGLRDLEERDHISVCAAQAGGDRVLGGSALMDHDVEVNCEGGVLGGC